MVPLVVAMTNLPENVFWMLNGCWSYSIFEADMHIKGSIVLTSYYMSSYGFLIPISSQQQVCVPHYPILLYLSVKNEGYI